MGSDMSETQSKLGSWVETWANIFIGYLINVVANFYFLPWFGYEVDIEKSFMIGIPYVALSVVRLYLIRRMFNRSQIFKL